MDNDALVEVLKEYVNEIREEIKIFRKCTATLKNDITTLKGITDSREKKCSECNKTLDDTEKRLRLLEKTDSYISSDIKESAKDLTSMAEKSVLEREIIDGSIKTLDDKIKTNKKYIARIWYAILVLALTIIGKFFLI